MQITQQYKLNHIINADCFDIFPLIADKSVDLIFADLPYGTTQAKWDSVLPLDKLWAEYARIIKTNGVILLTANQPFSSQLIQSATVPYKYSWIWEKSKATNYLNAKKQPMRAYEEILVFYFKQPTYNPQMRSGEPYYKGTALRPTDVYGQQSVTTVENTTGDRYPRNVIYFKTAESEGEVIHPTQKPVTLIEYLIKTYTNVGDLVLDNTAGSFSTALAAMLQKRNWVGIELDSSYCVKAQARINNFLKTQL